MIGSQPDQVEPVATALGVLSLRNETAADDAFLLSLFESVKGPEMAAIPVPDAMRRQLLAMQYQAMTAAYRSAFPAGRFSIATQNDMPIGRLITDQTACRFLIVYIALRPEWRGRGLATALMTAVLQRPKQSGLRCEATVAIGNLASLRLWSRLDFQERERSMTDVVMEWRQT